MIENGDLENIYDNDTDEKLLQAFQHYFYWKERFRQYRSHHSSVKARNYLLDIIKLSKTKRIEIITERKRVKQEQKQRKELGT